MDKVINEKRPERMLAMRWAKRRGGFSSFTAEKGRSLLGLNVDEVKPGFIQSASIFIIKIIALLPFYWSWLCVLSEVFGY